MGTRDEKVWYVEVYAAIADVPRRANALAERNAKGVRR